MTKRLNASRLQEELFTSICASSSHVLNRMRQ